MLRLFRPLVFTFHKVTLGLAAVVVVGMLLTFYIWPAQAQDNTTTTPTASAAQANSIFMPIVANDYDAFLATRLGYSTSVTPITQYANIRALHAGWYVDWGVTQNPVRPSGMTYMPMVRVHQQLTCGIAITADRVKCPYVEPHAYDYTPSADAIRTFAVANPGSTWLIGNEMDRLDWAGGNQDEMLPTLYPIAYKELYDIIKGADSTAKVAIGGIIEATPLRLEYLTTIWNKYQEYYGTTMPVDVWNVHNFVIAEYCRMEPDGAGGQERICYGGAVPPGATTNSGAYVGEDWKHIDHTAFDQQIRAFRQWMKDHGQQEKPLIVTEYGVLYNKIDCPQPVPGGCGDPHWVDLNNPQVIHDFMLWTFDYFANTADCNLGYTADDCHLVQRWAWFSLQNVWDFNPHASLYDKTTKQPLLAGEKFSQYAKNNHANLAKGY
ncbi:MAG: hypothetical protein R3C14_08405 [Caldilineaceae bacterium]